MLFLAVVWKNPRLEEIAGNVVPVTFHFLFLLGALTMECAARLHHFVTEMEEEREIISPPKENAKRHVELSPREKMMTT